MAFRHRFLTVLSTAMLVAAGLASSASAQSVTLGADVVSRYVWRGVDYGQSLSMQPTVAISSGGLTLGAWGSFAIDHAAANESDLYLTYAIETATGTLTVGITDYFFPSSGADFLDIDIQGQHVLEPFVAFDGPLNLMLGVNVTNDAEHSVYAEVGVPFQIDNVSFAVAGGATFGESAWYSTSKAGVINLSLSARKPLVLTDAFSLPVFVHYIINPYLRTNHFVFGFSITP